MALSDQVLSLASKVIKIISLKNIGIWSATAFICITSYTIFESRAAIVNFILNGREVDAPQASSFAVSDTSKSRIKQLVDSDSLINSIVILNADIRNNRRVPIYWYSDDATLQKSLDSLFSGRYGGIPLFTAEEKNNENVVGIINGEFSCGSYADTGSGGIFPQLSGQIPYLCRTSLPPYYGQFSGYISISLNRKPTDDEIASLKTETLNISTEVYFRDVLPANKKLNSTNP